MPLVAVPNPFADSGILPIHIDRPKTPPGISAHADDAEEHLTQQPPQVCDNDEGDDAGDWDDDTEWDEEGDDMPDIAGADKPNGQAKRTHGQRLVAVEGAVGKLDAKVEEQGKVLVAVDARTAQILTALQQGAVVTTTPDGVIAPKPGAAVAHPGAAALAQLFNTFGPWGIVLWLILNKGA